MIELKLSDKKEFSMTINKAQKILSLLEEVEYDKKADLNTSADADSSQSSEYSFVDTFVLGCATVLTYNEDELKNLLHNRAQKKIDTFISAIEIIEDIHDLKEAIFYFNVQKGISQKVSYIKKKKYSIKLYEQLNRRANFENETLQSVASKLAKLSHNTIEAKDDIEITLRYWDNDALQKELKTIKETILRYEDEILTFNATHQIKVMLSKSSIELIGL